MGAVCCAITGFISNTMYMTEKFAACCACTSLITCLITTLIITLGLGVGLGYNYCFVDFKTHTTRRTHVKFRANEEEMYFNPTPSQDNYRSVLRPRIENPIIARLLPQHPIYKVHREEESSSITNIDYSIDVRPMKVYEQLDRYLGHRARNKTRLSENTDRLRLNASDEQSSDGFSNQDTKVTRIPTTHT